MKKKIPVKGRLSVYLQWPLILSALLIVGTMAVGAVHTTAGAVMSVFTILYILIAMGIYFYQKKNVLAGLVEFSSEYAWIQKQLLWEMMQPYAIADDRGRLLWVNEAFGNLLGLDRHSRKSLVSMFPEITREVLEKKDEVSFYSYGVWKPKLPHGFKMGGIKRCRFIKPGAWPGFFPGVSAYGVSGGRDGDSPLQKGD